MQMLDLTLKILTGCGCWVPNSWTSAYKRLLYYIYTIFIFLLISTFTLSQFLDLILIVDNPDDFTDNFYILIGMSIACFKMLSLLVNRSNIALFVDILSSNPCSPLKPDEKEIRQKFDRLIETNTLHYGSLIEFTCSFSAVQSFFTYYWEGKLTYRAWLPFDYSSTVLFHFAYFHQLLSLLAGAALQVACDCLICGLLLHVCCQIEILHSRLKRIVHSPEILRHCVIHHNIIIKLACMLNRKFRFTITIQFIVSTLVVCTILYQLTKTDAKVVPLGLYMSCMLTQIFLYCWYGNEIRVKSLQLINSLFEIKWLSLRKNAQINLLTISKCGLIPIEFTSAYIIPMNLQSFMGLLKTSYSAYNILQQVQK